jgi:hypothetical protein
MGQQGRRLQSSKNDYRAVASHRSKHAARDLKHAKESPDSFARRVFLAFLFSATAG